MIGPEARNSLARYATAAEKTAAALVSFRQSVEFLKTEAVAVADEQRQLQLVEILQTADDAVFALRRLVAAIRKARDGAC